MPTTGFEPGSSGVKGNHYVTLSSFCFRIRSVKLKIFSETIVSFQENPIPGDVRCAKIHRDCP